ncbi:MAG TPA: zinc ribbon domain-containing protein [Actinokineospora sp.]|nr:zinc ribbon domain-containing protein [Actinokineospora sp.]
MPTYEFKCKACDQRFDVQRSMSESSAPAVCPDGHTDTVRLLTMAGLAGSATGAAPAQSGGGCCGGGCCG